MNHQRIRRKVIRGCWHYKSYKHFLQCSVVTCLPMLLDGVSVRSRAYDARVGCAGGLAVPHARVERFWVREELGVRAALGDTAGLEHQYLVGVDNRREAMCDHQCRASLDVPAATSV